MDFCMLRKKTAWRIPKQEKMMENVESINFTTRTIPGYSKVQISERTLLANLCHFARLWVEVRALPSPTDHEWGVENSPHVQQGQLLYLSAPLYSCQKLHTLLERSVAKATALYGLEGILFRLKFITKIMNAGTRARVVNLFRRAIQVLIIEAADLQK